MSDKEYSDEMQNLHDNAEENPHETQTKPEENVKTGNSAEEPDPGDVIAKLAEENNNLKEQLIRLHADMENLRKRTAREVSEARIYGVTNFARDMLVIADNLNRALSAIPAEARETDPQVKTLADGVEMTERTMMSVLQNHGVHKIEALGKKFDPHRHEAVFEVEDKNVPHNTVNQEVEAGYIIGDRVLRAAKVGIAKGGEKPSAARTAKQHGKEENL